MSLNSGSLDAFQPGTGTGGGGAGPAGPSGAPGANGWSPLTGIVSDGDRMVKRLITWVGGQGNPPNTDAFLIGNPMYIGPDGIVTDIAQAVDIGGADGAPGQAGAAGAPGPAGGIGPAGPSGISGLGGGLFMVWAEEGTNLSITGGTGGDGYQFSYGNGANQTRNGFLMPFECQLSRITVNKIVDDAATATIAVYGGNNVIGTIDIAGAGGTVIIDPVVDVPAGTLIRFRTTAVNAWTSGQGVVITAGFLTEGVVGPAGPAGGIGPAGAIGPAGPAGPAGSGGAGGTLSPNSLFIEEKELASGTESNVQNAARLVDNDPDTVAIFETSRLNSASAQINLGRTVRGAGHTVRVNFDGHATTSAAPSNVDIEVELLFNGARVKYIQEAVYDFNQAGLVVPNVAYPTEHADVFNQIRLVVRPESFGVGGTDNVQLRVSGIDVETSFVQAVEQFTTPLVSVISFDMVPGPFSTDTIYSIVPNLGESQNAEPYTAVNYLIEAGQTAPLGAIRLQPGFLYVFDYFVEGLQSVSPSSTIEMRRTPVGGTPIPVENWQMASLRGFANTDTPGTINAIIDLRYTDVAQDVALIINTTTNTVVPYNESHGKMTRYP